MLQHLQEPLQLFRHNRGTAACPGQGAPVREEARSPSSAMAVLFTVLSWFALSLKTYSTNSIAPCSARFGVLRGRNKYFKLHSSVRSKCSASVGHGTSLPQCFDFMEPSHTCASEATRQAADSNCGRAGHKGSHHGSLDEVLVDLCAGHAIQDAGVRLQDAVPQQVVVVEEVLVCCLLLLHTERLHTAPD